MKKITIRGVDKDIYRATLDNGLDVILIPNDSKSKKKNYYINYGVYYGGFHNEFVPLNGTKQKNYPAGIAHFLEHKMFEMEDGTSPFNVYSESGSYANAFTSYKSTCYVLSGSKKLKENLKYMFHMVGSPYFTKENVKKEQGIITEEIHMRYDDPDFLVSTMLYKNLYQKLPYRIPVIGSLESIQKITPADLYDCYQTFYRPSNMFLLVSGCFDENEIYTLICEEMAKQPKASKTAVVQKNYREPITVGKEYEDKKMNTKVEKVAIGYKMKRSNFSIKDDVVLNLYLNMLITLNFGSSSKFNEEVLQKHLVTRSGYMFHTAANIRSFIVEVDTLHSDVYIKALEEQLQNLSVTKEDLERMKKVWISAEVMKTDYADAMLDSFADDLVTYHDIVTNYVDLIRSMKVETMQQLIQELDFSNRSIAKIIPES